jgi:stage IV sporulation protein B
MAVLLLIAGFLGLNMTVKALFMSFGTNVAIGDPLLPRGLPVKFFKVKILSGQPRITWNPGQGIVPVATVPGRVDMQIKLLGLIPLNHMVVNVVPAVRVVPGGHSIGVLLHSRGVMVVGHAVITDPQGNKHNPALEAGILNGDIILKINGRRVQSEQQVRSEISRCGQTGSPVTLEIKRGQRVFTTRLNPVFCAETKRYRIGLYVRDSAAGIGTLTFYEPKSKKYGALGHVITDFETNRRIDLEDGQIVEAVVQGIRPGRRGQPGEKIGLFTGDGLTGNIEKNTSYGIFGSLRQPLANPLYPQPIPVALVYQVKRGPAEILTVLRGNRIGRYSVEILQVMPQNRWEGKGLVIKVIDPELLRQTGGIIQGMSGSPIIQNGRIVGAVTHVFVNDPTRGYGVLAEWMIYEANLLPKDKKVA